MKKLFAMLLMLLLCVGLAATAGAADGAARINGVKVLLNGTEQPVGTIHFEDEDELTFEYYGENFNKLNSNYKYRFGPQSGQLMKSYYITVDISATPHTARLIIITASTTTFIIQIKISTCSHCIIIIIFYF